jgi:hypothetical protein
MLTAAQIDKLLRAIRGTGQILRDATPQERATGVSGPATAQIRAECLCTSVRTSRAATEGSV